MKPLTRKQELLAALAEGRVPNITPLTAEEILLYEQAKREAASKNPKWEDIADKPFGSEEAVLFHEQEVTFSVDEYGRNIAMVEADNVVEFNDDNAPMFILTYNGYEAECYGYDSTGGVIMFTYDPSASYNKIRVSYLAEKSCYQIHDVSPDNHISATIGLEWRNLKQLDPTYLPKIAAVPDASGDTPTAAEFNALLAALRNAGYMATDTGL